MYPGSDSGRGGCDDDTSGLGLLRLHSTFRHDLKIYASDEGRVQMTAAAFAKGLLALEGELTPILVQMVKRFVNYLEFLRTLFTFKFFSALIQMVCWTTTANRQNIKP